MGKPSTLKSVWNAIFERDDGEESRKKEKEKKFFAREFSGAVTQKLKRILSSRVFRLAKSTADMLSHIPARVYGTVLLCFGLVGTLMYFLGISHDESIVTPIVGIALSVLSLPLLLSDKPMPILLQDFKPTDYLFFEFFCMKRHSFMESRKKFPTVLAILIGFLPAVLSAFVPYWIVALAIGIAVCVYIGMESPEFIFLVSLACVPYLRFLNHADIILGIAILLAVISFMRKVFYGRRVLYIEQYDLIIGAMLLFILISGIFIKGEYSFSGSLRHIVFAFGYFLAGNIITNRRLAELSTNSVVISGAIASVVSIVQLVIILINSSGEITNETLSPILARADGIAVLLIASVIFSMGMLKQSVKKERVLFAISSVLCVLALVLSGEVLAITSLILGIVAHIVIKSNKLPGLILPFLLVLSVLVLLLPNNFLNIIFKYSPSVVSAEELYDLWLKSGEVFLNNLAVGIGIGSESFIEEMSALGVSGHNDSSNLLIELGLEAGVFALICFIILLITRISHRSSQYLYVRNSQMERASNLSGACLFSLLAFGMVNYIWSDMSAYYIFWCIFGIGSASLRVAKKDYNDRVIYYEESSALDSSVIDIEIG